MLLERIYPYDKSQRLLREGFFNDFFWYGLVQTYVLGLVIYGVTGWIDASTHLERIHVIRALPLWLQVAIFFVVHDLYIYWFHRWQHNG